MQSSTPLEKRTLPNEQFFPIVVDMLAEKGSVTFRAKGNSMYPFIREGDCVRIERCPHVRRGDIVLACLPDGHYVLHRVYSLEGDRLTLMGDRNLQVKEQCTAKHIIGKATCITRPDGHDIWCDSPSELRKARLWQYLLPLRRYLLKIDSILCRRKNSSE